MCIGACVTHSLCMQGVVPPMGISVTGGDGEFQERDGWDDWDDYTMTMRNNGHYSLQPELYNGFPLYIGIENPTRCIGWKRERWVIFNTDELDHVGWSCNVENCGAQVPLPTRVTKWQIPTVRLEGFSEARWINLEVSQGCAGSGRGEDASRICLFCLF